LSVKPIIKIDDYAQSMFRFEKINAGWVTRCAHYLTHVFGDVIKGSTVIDYAFGRGNWALAFREAGAKKVIAVDAAKSNVDRFSSYLQVNAIEGIEVIEGNVLENPITAEADIIWAYGILPHIDEPEGFIRSLTSMWREDGRGIGLIYAYNDKSLRQVVIDLARQVLVYDSYDVFLDDSFFFSHHARMRVRDDLTAPHVFWYSTDALVKLLASADAFAERCVDSFGVFENTENAEFRPHHIIFSRDGTSQVSDVPQGLGVDEQVIRDFGDAILRAASAAVAKKFVIGLMNTHFDSLAHGGYQKALVEDFLYLLYAFRTLELTAKNAQQKAILDLALASINGAVNNPIPKILKHSLIAAHLSTNAIRI
jgi:hypothetical protein